jgi:hypothetical protein
MTRQHKEFFAGFAIASCLAIFVGILYGTWKEKLGELRGHKEGNIEVINFLAKHFPAPNGEASLSGNEFGIKWYRVIVVESNGVKTLKIKNEM